MLRCVIGKEIVGPEYLDIDTGKISTRYWEASWVPEEEYPHPLVTSRYSLYREVEGNGSHIVLVKNKVIKVGSWQDCVSHADNMVASQATNPRDEQE